MIIYSKDVHVTVSSFEGGSAKTHVRLLYIELWASLSSRLNDPNVLESRQYYRIAHSFQEDITEQPTILIGGKLKEYQV